MIGSHKKVVLQFSGGKDSTVLLHKAIPWKDQIVVLWADSGMAFPHVRKHVEDVTKEWGFRLATVRPPDSAYKWTQRIGLPSDVLSPWRTPEWAWTSRKAVDQRLVTPMQCCQRNLWWPMWQFVQKGGYTLMLRGAREADAHRGVRDGYKVEGVTMGSPLWDWTDSDINSYIKKNELPLPSHYSEVNESLDCWGCTGHLTVPSAAARLRYVRTHHEAYWNILSKRLKRVREATTKDLANVLTAMEVAEHG